jgi:hypothetical protein
MKGFRQQMLALASCRMMLVYTSGDKVINAKVDPVEQFAAWLQDDDDGQKVMWPGVLTPSEPFFKTLTEFAVPLDQRAVATLTRTWQLQGPSEYRQSNNVSCFQKIGQCPWTNTAR